MNSINHLLAIASIVLLFSCSSKKTNADNPYETIDIDVKTETVIAMNELFDSIEIIELEGVKNSFFRDCNKLIIENNMIIIKDGTLASLFVFDKSGNFISNSSAKRGRSSNTYFALNDFIVNKYSGNIEILDFNGKVLTFDSAFNFVSKFKIPAEKGEYYSAFIQTDKDQYLLMTKDDTTKICTYSRKNDKILNKNLLSSDIKGLAFGTVTPIQTSDNIPYIFINNNSNSITRIDIDRLKSSGGYKYNLGDLELNNKEFKTEKEFMSFIKENVNKYAFVGNILINDKYLISKIFYNFSKGLMFSDTKLVIHSMKNRETKVVNNRFKDNKILSDINFADTLAIYSFCSEIKNIEYMYDQDILTSESKNILSQISENSNGVIIKYYIKE